MTIKNIGSKIISIGTTVLLPDATMKANKAICETPAVKAFVKKGLLSIVDDAKPKAGNDAKAKAEAEAKAKAEAEAKAKAEAEAKAKAEAEAKAAAAGTPAQQ